MGGMKRVQSGQPGFRFKNVVAGASYSWAMLLMGKMPMPGSAGNLEAQGACSHCLPQIVSGKNHGTTFPLAQHHCTCQVDCV